MFLDLRFYQISEKFIDKHEKDSDDKLLDTENKNSGVDEKMIDLQEENFDDSNDFFKVEKENSEL